MKCTLCCCLLLMFTMYWIPAFAGMTVGGWNYAFAGMTVGGWNYAFAGMTEGGAAGNAAEKIKVAVVTGGHDFTEKPFLAMFEANPDIAFTHVVLKDDSEIFEDISAWPYDVIVLFNMTQKISEKRQANFLQLMDRGVGLVVLHHAIADYTEWPEFRNIIGTRYFIKEVTENGVTHPASQYEHGVDFKIHIEDPNHPVTRGVADFGVNDETYKGYTLAPDNHVLLTTDNPKSEHIVGWTRQYREARVCFIQMGHGDSIFANDAYRQILAQAIRWTSGKPRVP